MWSSDLRTGLWEWELTAAGNIPLAERRNESGQARLGPRSVGNGGSWPRVAVSTCRLTSEVIPPTPVRKHKIFL